MIADKPPVGGRSTGKAECPTGNRNSSKHGKDEDEYPGVPRPREPPDGVRRRGNRVKISSEPPAERRRVSWIYPGNTRPNRRGRAADVTPLTPQVYTLYSVLSPRKGGACTVPLWRMECAGLERPCSARERQAGSGTAERSRALSPEWETGRVFISAPPRTGNKHAPPEAKRKQHGTIRCGTIPARRHSGAAAERRGNTWQKRTGEGRKIT